MSETFEPLPLPQWIGTRDTLQGYASVLGKIRRSLTPYQRHWWHVSLRVSASGLTTTPIPAPQGSFELGLDLTRHRAWFAASTGDRDTLALSGRPATELLDWAVHRAGVVGAEPSLERQDHPGEAGSYDRDAAGRYFRALVRIDSALKSFGGALRGPTSPVQLFPHHFDLSMNWFSGRLVPGVDPEDEESADEQMNFGFSTGDGYVPDAYFYATAYPLPEDLPRTDMPPGATWHTEGARMAVLPYTELLGEAGDEPLRSFLTTLQQAGARLMTG